jgi:probable F420-dependent oxidoreductase
VKLGVMPFVTGPLSHPDIVAELAERVEASPAESLWAYEHVVYPQEYDSVYPYDAGGKMTSSQLAEDRPDPLQWLGHVAALTRRIRLGTGLVLLPLHNPLILAKRLATLDRLSGGRLIAGFGIGWLAEEYDALGVPFRERGARADEYLQILQTLWAPGAASFQGRFHSFTDVHSNPKPVAPAGVPIVIGGHSRPAMRRTARYGQGLFLLRQTPERVAELLGLLADEAKEAGRDIGDFEITVDAPRTAEDARRYAGLGVHRFLLSLRADDPAKFAERTQRYAETVLAEVPS